MAGTLLFNIGDWEFHFSLEPAIARTTFKMAASVVEKKNFDEMCSNFEQMELDVRFLAVGFTLLSMRIV